MATTKRPAADGGNEVAYPVGVFIGLDVQSTSIDGVEYAIGADGCVTGPA